MLRKSKKDLQKRICNRSSSQINKLQLLDSAEKIKRGIAKRICNRNSCKNEEKYIYINRRPNNVVNSRLELLVENQLLSNKLQSAQVLYSSTIQIVFLTTTFG